MPAMHTQAFFSVTTLTVRVLAKEVVPNHETDVKIAKLMDTMGSRHGIWLINEVSSPSNSETLYHQTSRVSAYRQGDLYQTTLAMPCHPAVHSRECTGLKRHALVWSPFTSSRKRYQPHMPITRKKALPDRRMQDVPSPASYAIQFGALPALWAFAIPALLSMVTDFSVSSSDRQRILLLLLLTKRLALYTTAGSVLDLASKRSGEVPASLGERIGTLNEEIFSVFGSNYTASIKAESSETLKLLDKTDGQTQAVALPALVAASLIISFIPVYLARSVLGDVDVTPEVQDAVRTVVTQLIPFVALVSNAAVGFLFSKVELEVLAKSATPANNDRNIEVDVTTGTPVVSLAAAALVITCFASPPGGWAWPAQNVCNAFIAAVVARAVQLPRLPWILAALAGLACYDLVAVTGTQALGDGGASIMEAVARAKAGLPSAGDTATAAGVAGSMKETIRSVDFPLPAPKWLPGLLQVSVNGRPSDLLGLGDVVFPSMLSGWARRWDIAERAEGRNDPGLYSASLAGFVAGCLACELLQTGKGQPALIYLVPAMSAAVIAKGVQSQQLGRMWKGPE